MEEPSEAEKRKTGVVQVTHSYRPCLRPHSPYLGKALCLSYIRESMNVHDDVQNFIEAMTGIISCLEQLSAAEKQLRIKTAHLGSLFGVGIATHDQKGERQKQIWAIEAFRKVAKVLENEYHFDLDLAKKMANESHFQQQVAIAEVIGNFLIGPSNQFTTYRELIKTPQNLFLTREIWRCSEKTKQTLRHLVYNPVKKKFIYIAREENED